MHNKIEVIILAGGMGTRLREVTGDLPKPMAPVDGLPFLHYLLKWLAGYPVEKIIMSTGFKSGAVSDYFGDSFLNMSIVYSVEQQALGTGGAVWMALQKTSSENILVLNGDTFFPVDINRLHSFHIEKKNMISVALKPMDNFSRYGSVECEGNAIIRFNEKKFCRKGLINGGIYFLNRRISEQAGMPEAFSLEKDLLEKIAGSGVIKGLIFDDPFLDIGVPEDYFRAGSVLIPGKQA